MSFNPLKVTQWSLDHSGGTKSYHIYVILDEVTKRAMTVFRYGKTGAFGQLQFTHFDTLGKAERFADKKDSEKSGGGYRQTGISKVDSCATELALRTKIGLELQLRLNGAELSKLAGVSYTAPDKPEREEDPILRDRRAKQARDQEARNMLAAAQAAEEAEKNAQNAIEIPNWGRF